MSLGTFENAPAQSSYNFASGTSNTQDPYNFAVGKPGNVYQPNQVLPPPIDRMPMPNQLNMFEGTQPQFQLAQPVDRPNPNQLNMYEGTQQDYQMPMLPPQIQQPVDRPNPNQLNMYEGTQPGVRPQMMPPPAPPMRPVQPMRMPAPVVRQPLRPMMPRRMPMRIGRR